MKINAAIMWFIIVGIPASVCAQGYVYYVGNKGDCEGALVIFARKVEDYTEDATKRRKTTGAPCLPTRDRDGNVVCGGYEFPAPSDGDSLVVMCRSNEELWVLDNSSAACEKPSQEVLTKLMPALLKLLAESQESIERYIAEKKFEDSVFDAGGLYFECCLLQGFLEYADMHKGYKSSQIYELASDVFAHENGLCSARGVENTMKDRFPSLFSGVVGK